MSPLLVAYSVTFMASVVPFFITARYRLAIVPVLLVGAGFALTEMWDRVRAKQWGSLVVIAIVLGGLASAVNVHMMDVGFAHMHNRVATILAQRGDCRGATRELARALEQDPGSLEARYNLGLLLQNRAHRGCGARVQARHGTPPGVPGWVDRPR